MQYNPLDFTSYRTEPPVEEYRSYRQPKPDGFEAVYLVSTTHRFGLCRESQPRTDEYFFDQVQQFFLVGSNNKFAWLSSRCRETDNDIYSISTVSLTQITESDVYMRIYDTFNEIPLRPVPIQAPRKVETWSMMCP